MTEEILSTAINKEIEARDFYNRISENVTKPKVKKMTTKISREEDRHRTTLSSLFQRLFKKDFTPGEFEPNPKIKVAEAEVYDSGTALEIVSVAIGLEDEAIEFYADQAERTDDSDARALLIKLVKFEMGHKKKMQSQYERLKNGFSWTG
jgi:rubrerythrin